MVLQVDYCPIFSPYTEAIPLLTPLFHCIIDGLIEGRLLLQHVVHIYTRNMKNSYIKCNFYSLLFFFLCHKIIFFCFSNVCLIVIKCVRLFTFVYIWNHFKLLKITCTIFHSYYSIFVGFVNKNGFLSQFELFEWLLFNAKCENLSAISWWEQVTFQETMSARPTLSW